jgi:hypothetical protein
MNNDKDDDDDNSWERLYKGAITLSGTFQKTKPVLIYLIQNRAGHVTHPTPWKKGGIEVWVTNLKYFKHNVELKEHTEWF